MSLVIVLALDAKVLVNGADNVSNVEYLDDTFIALTFVCKVVMMPDIFLKCECTEAKLLTI